MTDITHAVHHGFGAFGGYGNNQGYGNNNGVGLEELILAGQLNAGFNSNQESIHTASVSGLNATAEAARDVTDATRDVADAVNTIGQINLQSVERNGGENRAATERTAGETRAAADRNAMSAEQRFSDIRSELAKQHGEIQLDACKNTGDLARQADQNAAAAARQLAECCCDIKQLVTSENGATRQLLQSQALDEANRRIVELQNQVNVNAIADAVSSRPGRS